MGEFIDVIFDLEELRISASYNWVNYNIYLICRVEGNILKINIHL